MHLYFLLFLHKVVLLIQTFLLYKNLKKKKFWKANLIISAAPIIKGLNEREKILYLQNKCKDVKGMLILKYKNKSTFSFRGGCHILISVYRFRRECGYRVYWCSTEVFLCFCYDGIWNIYHNFLCWLHGYYRIISGIHMKLYATTKNKSLAGLQTYKSKLKTCWP